MRTLLALLMMMPGLAAAQGYAGLGSAVEEGYAQVERGRAITFPQDHLPHPDFRIEWWYVTANLLGADGQDYGLQWTLFRSALAPPSADETREGWSSRQFWMAHAAVTSAETHRSAERFARGGVGQAGVEGAPFRAWLDDWRFESLEGGADAPFAPLRLTARAEDFAYTLTLTTAAPPVLQGEAGFSVKSERGQASHYYAQPFFELEGEIEIDGERVAVTGRAWMDREWSTQPLTADQTGWDWFALRPEDDVALMVYRLRHEDGDDYVTGNWATPDGLSEPLAPGTIEIVPIGWTDIDDRRVPTEWRIAVPSRGIEITTRPVNA
ncbi:MAG: lipocalin-like domain-containing protein, partial [Pseudomonadota bacterium]